MHLFYFVVPLINFWRAFEQFWLKFSLAQLPSINIQILWKLDHIFGSNHSQIFVIKFSNAIYFVKVPSLFPLVPTVAPVFLLHLLFWSFIWNFKAGRKAHSSLSMVLCQCYSCPFPCLWPFVCCLIPFSCHLYTNWQLLRHSFPSCCL